jgi:TRAP-type uncharacterized transport system fused permease subunit
VPALLLSGAFLILLGMGMPTPAVYIMGAALLAPILRQFNLPEFQVHLFMLFYACLSAVTPPVAVANFAAAAIAGVNPMAIAGYAVKLAIGGFVVPFFFLFNPGLTLEGGLANIAIATFFGTACTVFASYALHGLLGARDIAWPPAPRPRAVLRRHDRAANRAAARRHAARRGGASADLSAQPPSEGRRSRRIGLPRPAVFRA